MNKDNFSIYVTTKSKTIQAIGCKDKIVDIKQNIFFKLTYDIDEHYQIIYIYI